jgi:hypothetical protein
LVWVAADCLVRATNQALATTASITMAMTRRLRWWAGWGRLIAVMDVPFDRWIWVFVGIAVDLDRCSVRRGTGWDIHRMADWVGRPWRTSCRNADGNAAVAGAVSLPVDPTRRRGSRIRRS